MLVGFCALALLLIIVAIIPVIRQVVRLRSRLKHLADAPLLRSVQSLQMQSNHLSRSQADVQILARRCAAIGASLRDAVPDSGLPEMRATAQSASHEIRELVTDLK